MRGHAPLTSPPVPPRKMGNTRLDLRALRCPIVCAPMAGGPSTPDLVAAVGDAGGLGFLAGAYRSAQQLAEDVAETRRLTTAPFGVNLFVPSAAVVDEAAVLAYRDELGADASRLSAGLGTPAGGDDDWDAKLAALLSDPVPAVSFAFGCPPARVVAALQAVGSTVLVTVTTPAEGSQASAAGADALVAQGIEAGAHRGGFVDVAGVGEYGLLALLRLLAAEVRLPVVASGGIADGAAVAATLVAGAVAAQLGTAFLRCPEAGTSAVHRAALGRTGETTLTRAFTGRRARAIVNRFVTEHGASAPAAYPQVHHVTAPLRAAARAAGDPDALNLWAGQAYPLGRDLPAGELIRELTRETSQAVERLAPGLQAAVQPPSTG